MKTRGCPPGSGTSPAIARPRKRLRNGRAWSLVHPSPGGPAQASVTGGEAFRGGLLALVLGDDSIYTNKSRQILGAANDKRDVPTVFTPVVYAPRALWRGRVRRRPVAGHQVRGEAGAPEVAVCPHVSARCGRFVASLDCVEFTPARPSGHEDHIYATLDSVPSRCCQTWRPIL